MMLSVRKRLARLYLASYPGSQLTWGGKESLVSNVHTCVKLYTFFVYRNLRDSCPCTMACGMSETNA